MAAAGIGGVGAECHAQAGPPSLEQRHGAAAQHQVAGRVVDYGDAMRRQQVAFGRGEPDAMGDRQSFTEQPLARHLRDQPALYRDVGTRDYPKYKLQ